MMRPAPIEIQQAELSDASLAYKLVPSKAAVQDAKDEKIVLKDGDIPLFKADRLAFRGPNGGPHVSHVWSA